jgi:hypothetical protein
LLLERNVEAVAEEQARELVPVQGDGVERVDAAGEAGCHSRVRLRRRAPQRSVELEPAELRRIPGGEDRLDLVERFGEERRDRAGARESATAAECGEHGERKEDVGEGLFALNPARDPDPERVMLLAPVDVGFDERRTALRGHANRSDGDRRSLTCRTHPALLLGLSPPTTLAL